MAGTRWNIVLLGGSRSEDGLFDFQRKILFRPVLYYFGRMLPENGSVLYVRTEDEDPQGFPSVVCGAGESFAERLSRIDCQDDGFTVVCESPFPNWGTDFPDRCRTLQCQTVESVLAVRWNGRLPAAVFPSAVLKQVIRKKPQSLKQAAACAEHLGCRKMVCTLPEEHPVVVSAGTAYLAQRGVMKRTAERLMESGVTLYDPYNTMIAADAEIGAGTVVYPGTMIKPGCVIGENCEIGPYTVLDHAEIGSRTVVNQAQILHSRVGEDANIGPYTVIRNQSGIGDRDRIGNFVEVKNSTVGSDTAAAHLTYIGDADVGGRVNFGCGSITVNYDGVTKHRTAIGSGSFIGCNTNLVAPVTVGENAFTAAGSTITESVPDGALAIARERQQNREGWTERRAENLKNGK